MKICMYNITTAIKIGGIETYYWEVSNVLQKLEHEVEIITGKGNYIKYLDIPIKQFSYKPRKDIIDLGNRFRKLMERVSFFLNSYSYLKKQKYDVILIHKPLDFFVTYFVKKSIPDIKVVFVSGGEDFYGFDKFFSNYVDFIISVSNDNARKIEQRYKRDVTIIPNGVDVSKFSKDITKRNYFREKFNLNNKKVLISVGRVVGWKGFQLVIKSLSINEDFYYILVGDGEYSKKLKLLAKKEGVLDRVLFIGSVSHNSLSDYLNIADVFVQPSIGHEAFGITIIESMSCGVPVVASRNGGMVDIVKDGINGYLFDIGDTEQMIEKINICYAEKDVLSKNALSHARDNFTWDFCVKNLLETIT